MTATKASRPVTQPCATCRRRFTPARGDARYCSAACRQRAHRARANLDDLDRRIEAARLHYWQLVREKAEAHGVEASRVVTDEAQEVDLDGAVHMHGQVVGHTTPHRAGWAAWGLQAAGPPWSAPPSDAG